MEFRYFEWDDRFSKSKKESPFEQLLDLFQQLLMVTGGDVSESLKWMSELDKQYNMTDEFDDYGLGDFIQDLKDRGYIDYDDETASVKITGKTERSLREKSLEEIFQNLKKGGPGSHKTMYTGKGLERQPETRNWTPGDDIGNIDHVGSMMNMLKHSSLDQFDLQEKDLRVHETDHNTSVATALLIDVSHSMVLYGEDRITPAKKVAMGLSELIMNKYAKDSLDIIAFGNDAWEIDIADLPYLKVGPYHTNTKKALEKARHILQRRKHSNKQIFMITDGKPSCMFRNGKLYTNSFGLDRQIVNKVLDEAVKCRREQIDITTFMIARDPYLQNFVRNLTDTNKGRAYFASLDNLGGFILEDYVRNRKKRVR